MKASKRRQRSPGRAATEVAVKSPRLRVENKASKSPADHDRPRLEASDPETGLLRAIRLGHSLANLRLSPDIRGGAAVQRVTGIPEKTHVEVDGGGPLWYGRVVESASDNYQIRIGGTDRVVTVPESQVRLHPVVQAVRVRRSVRQAPGGAGILALVDAWVKRTGPLHDSMKTLELMARAYLLSSDERMSKLLSTEEGLLQTRKIIQELEQEMGRQLVQFWDEKPQTILKRLGDAWLVFKEGVKQLKDSSKKLDLYLDKCLNHDKGYAQTYSATQSYLEIAISSGGSDLSFSEVVRKALDTSINFNIWTGGMEGSGKIIDQLKRGTDKKSKLSAEKQEEMMWGHLIKPLVDANSPSEPDWDYAKIVKKSEDKLFQLVQQQVEIGVKLNKKAMQKAIQSILDYL